MLNGSNERSGYALRRVRRVEIKPKSRKNNSDIFHKKIYNNTKQNVLCHCHSLTHNFYAKYAGIEYQFKPKIHNNNEILKTTTITTSTKNDENSLQLFAIHWGIYERKYRTNKRKLNSDSDHCFRYNPLGNPRYWSMRLRSVHE